MSPRPRIIQIETPHFPCAEIGLLLLGAMVLKARRKRGRVGRALGNPRRQIYVWEDTVGLFLSERRQKKLCLFESFLDSLPFCPISSFAMFNKKPNHFPQSCWFDLSISFWRCCESTSHSCRDTGSSLRKVLPNSYCYNAIAACFKKYFKETDLSVTRWLFKSGNMEDNDC